MGKRLRDISFRGKLVLYAGLTTAVALVLACVAFAVFDYLTFREAVAAKMTELAQVVASNSTAALTFEDYDAAKEILGALKADPLITRAALFNSQGRIAAERVLEGAVELPPLEAAVPADRLEGGLLHLQYPVILERERIGTVYLQRSMADQTARLVRYAGISALVLVLALVSAFLISIRLQGALTRPVLELVGASKRITEQGDYSVRAAKFGEDELGHLTDSFNEMVRQIQAQTNALQEAQEKLELRVSERTRDLSAAKLAAEGSAQSLQESEERIRAIMDTVADGILTLDAAGRITGFNQSAERIFGYTLREILGKNAFVLIPRARHEPYEQYVKRYLSSAASGKAGPEREVEGQRKNGEAFPISLRVAEMRHRGEEVLIWSVQDISERKEAQRKELELNKQLVGMARQAGMAEVATGVLHNVGNVLNSVNVSASLVEERVRQSRLGGLSKAVGLLEIHRQELGEFLTQDEQGRVLPGYLSKLAGHLQKEQQELLGELQLLVKNVEHIKEIVSMQQSYAGSAGFLESSSPIELVEDALRMNAAALDRHEVEVVRDFQPVPAIQVDRHKVIQILVNLIRNAKYAVSEAKRPDKRIVLHVHQPDPQTVNLEVEDNGVGIPAENLTRIFAHGFTTRPAGHGFGLHLSALSAKEMGGRLAVVSDPVRRGAHFTLTLPLQTPQGAVGGKG